jgi:hypothetical protein
MKNHFEIHFELKPATGHLEIVDWNIAIGTSRGKCSGKADKQRRVKNAHITPFQLALAMAQFKVRQTTEFPLDDKLWSHFRENLQKLVRPKSRKWLIDFIGGPQPLPILFDLDDKQFLRLRENVIRPEEIVLQVADEQGTPAAGDVEQMLIRHLRPKKRPGRGRNVAASQIEKDEKVRSRMQEAAREMLGVSGLGDVNELILGKAAYLSKVLETQSFTHGLAKRLGNLRDEIRLAATLEEFIDCHGEFRVLRSDANRLEPFFRDIEVLDEATKMIQDMETEYLKAIATLIPAGKSKLALTREQTEMLNKSFAATIDKCRVGEMNMRLHECRKKMETYVG